MKNKFLTITSIIITIATLMTMLPSCKPITAASSYLAVVPNIMYSGRSEAISLSLFSGDTLVRDIVEVTLLKDGQTVTKTKQVVDGSGTVTLNIPDNADGKYELQVKGGAFTDKTTIQIQESYVVFVETDKPIYKPGQTMHIRVLTLDSELKPTTQSVTIDILDAKGIKIYRSIVQTDDYGMATVELPISNEPNLGTWKINVTTDKAKNQLDVQVEEYVLPKYEVTVDLPKEWFLVTEPIKGQITSTYSFGKPVVGTMTITATKYVGQWQQYATVTKDINGSTDFEIPAAQYVAGTPAAGGQGNIQLDITVTEKSTGYVEKTSRLLTVAQSSVNLELIPESSVFKPGLPFSFLIITETPDNKPVDIKVDATVTYSNSKFDVIKTDKKTLQTVKGKAILDINPPEDAIALSIDAFELTPVSSVQPARASKVLQASYSPSGNFIHLEQISEGTPKVGEKIVFNINSTNQAVNFYYEVIARGKVVFSDYTKNKEISITTTPLMAPTSKLLVYQILPNSEVAADYLPFNVEAVYPQEVEAGFNTTEAKPGEEVQLNITTEGKAKVGIAVVDKSVFILAENRMNLQQVFDELERLYMEPQAEIHEVSFYPVTTTIGAADVFKNAGVVVMTNKKVPTSKEYEAQGSGNFLEKIMRFFHMDNIGFGAEKGVVTSTATTTSVPQTTAPPSVSGLEEVQRVRQFFPETWLWLDATTDANGKFTQKFTVPDSITTWMLRAVAVSKEKGLGVAENSLTVFQPFFLTIDLPYSAIRGEEFPVRVAVYNYLDTTQNVQVDIEQSDWYELLDSPTKTITIGANDIGGTEFTIRPAKIGINEIKISARSSQGSRCGHKNGYYRAGRRRQGDSR